MTRRDITQLGFPEGPLVGLALRVAKRLVKQKGKEQALALLQSVQQSPRAYLSDPLLGELSAAVMEEGDRPHWVEREAPAPYRIWGSDLEPTAVEQLQQAVRLPVAVRAALMPDAHPGYGLPIGGVLATENAVIPYAVGVDIACRMKLSVFEIPGDQLERWRDSLVNALRRETLFGAGAAFRRPNEHEVMDEDWSITPLTRKLRDEKAWPQLGSSGSGNHFVEFGILTIPPTEVSSGETGPAPAGSLLSLPPGTYVALLSHSGSRGTGAMIASHYSNLAMKLRAGLPPELKRLAWLDLDSEAGQEYWAAMNLMGRYASANHAVIHRRIAKALGAQVIAGVENHHNFAWKETHDGREVIVHRKGATPAGAGVLGVIPGSMASPAFVVRGRGSPEALESASHGAGRRMSRTAAKEKFRWSQIKPLLQERGVELLSAGIDENPLVYKDIEQVMSQQTDLVEVVARFDPKIVRMAEEGERAED
ncbi:MAG: RtcB family protein [Phycisphaerae bacterium]|nr:RtcB family protein [Phycisphaerae bacterium]MDW8261562.1 RtcB family protein [Phycisphaerales bacterium]